MTTRRCLPSSRSRPSSFYEILFNDRYVQEYERLARGYVRHWYNNEDQGTQYCGPCAVCRKLEDAELFHLYYSTLPLTPTVIVDAAVVLLMRKGCCSSSSSDDDYHLIHPGMIAYHLFFNCCFIKGSSAATTAAAAATATPTTNNSSIADFLHNTMNNYNYFGELNFKKLSYEMNLPSSKECHGHCGQLQRIVLDIAVNNQAHQQVVFVGAEEEGEREEDDMDVAAAAATEDDTTTANRTAKQYSDTRMSMVYTILMKHKQAQDELFSELGSDGEDGGCNDGEADIFSKMCGGNCRICANMILSRYYAPFEKWEKQFEDMKRELKGSNIPTIVTETFNQIKEDAAAAQQGDDTAAVVVEATTTNDCFLTGRGLTIPADFEYNCQAMIKHKRNNTCRYNTLRFVKFFDTFTDMKKISDMINVKHITDTYLNSREQLVCSDLYLAVWLERVMWGEKNATNDKVSRAIVQTFKNHLF